MVYCVGLTGSIASGKTTVAELFLQQGVEVIHADVFSREITKKNQPAYHAIVEHYGQGILNSDGELNRKKLRSMIVSNQKERAWMEHLLHPLIRQKIKKRVSSSTTAYCLVEIPLLITKQAYPYINRILLVTAPRETQIVRLMQRDQCSREDAIALLSTQPQRKVRLEHADDMLMNSSGFDVLTQAVSSLHEQYLLKSKLAEGQ